MPSGMGEGLVFETLQATSLRFSFYRSAVVLPEQPSSGVNAGLAQRCRYAPRGGKSSSP